MIAVDVPVDPKTLFDAGRLYAANLDPVEAEQRRRKVYRHLLGKSEFAEGFCDYVMHSHEGADR